MSREIKIRVYDNERNQLEYPINKIIVAEDGTEFNVICYRFMNGGMPVITSLGDCIKYPSRYISQQFTGLPDKNGKENYHKDIMKDALTGLIVTVEYGEYQGRTGAGYGWYLQRLNGNLYIPYPFNLDGWEIIGTIFENPELLEEK